MHLILRIRILERMPPQLLMLKRLQNHINMGRVSKFKPNDLIAIALPSLFK